MVSISCAYGCCVLLLCRNTGKLQNGAECLKQLSGSDAVLFIHYYSTGKKTNIFFAPEGLAGKRKGGRVAGSVCLYGLLALASFQAARRRLDAPRRRFHPPRPPPICLSVCLSCCPAQRAPWHSTRKKSTSKCGLGIPSSASSLPQASLGVNEGLKYLAALARLGLCHQGHPITLGNISSSLGQISRALSPSPGLARCDLTMQKIRECMYLPKS